jgi:hypothetical protein
VTHHCRFFRPDQARDIFGACRDNDERLAFVSKVLQRLLLLHRPNALHAKSSDPYSKRLLCNARGGVTIEAGDVQDCGGQQGPGAAGGDDVHRNSSNFNNNNNNNNCNSNNMNNHQCVNNMKLIDKICKCSG